MKGPRELKDYVSRYREGLKRIRFDCLLIFKLERCRKWRKQSRRPRDGYDKFRDQTDRGE